jgi:hypothetical protein
MAGAHPHYRSVRSTSPVILKQDTGSSGNGWEDVAGRGGKPCARKRAEAERAPCATCGPAADWRVAKR